MSKRDYVIVVAAKAPRAGVVKTRLCPELSPENAATLASAFLIDTLNLATSPALAAGLILALDGLVSDLTTDMPVSPETRIIAQSGNSLGERLVSMIEDSFAAGYRAVCVIGSDTPHLPPAFLLEAWGRLQQGSDVVLGPADDGGYYLVALSRPLPGLFQDIPWGTASVLEVTRNRAASEGLSVSLLPPWYDIDTPEDLRRLNEDLKRQVAQAPITAKKMETLALW